MTPGEHHEQTQLFGFEDGRDKDAAVPGGGPANRAEDAAVVDPGEAVVGGGEVVVGRFPDLEADLCRRVGMLSATRQLSPVAVVVGSHLVGRRLRVRLVRQLGAVAGVSVVTLARFVSERAAEAEGRAAVTSTRIVRERLLQRLVSDSAADLEYLGQAGRRPHFPRALAATITDLRQAGIDPDGGWSRAIAASAAPEGDALSGAGRPDKADDLARLYAGYCRELARRGLADDAAIYADAAAVLEAEAALGRETAEAALGREAAEAAVGRPDGVALLFYGLYDLNSVQERFVRAALTVGADLYVPLPRGVGDEEAPILSVAASLGLSARRLAPPPVIADRERVAVVWQPPRTTTPPLDADGDGTLTVASVSDERGEDREAARVLLEAARDGAPFHDCAVVVPHADAIPRVAAGLRAAGLPIACRVPDPGVGGRLLLLLADCLAPPFGRPFGRRAVLDLLTAAPSCVVECRSCESALWLDEARRAGVTAGAEQWVDRIGRRRGDLERRVDRVEEPSAAGEEGESLTSARLRLAAARGLESAVGALCRTAAGLPATAGWAEWCAALGVLLDEVFAGEPAAAARDALERARSLDVLDEEVDVAAVADVLRELTGATRAPVGSVGRDGVAVLTPLEMRGLSFHTVVFTGLAEGGFPVRGRPDPILTDAERRRVAEAVGVRLPLAEDRAAEALLLFAFACEAARERLVLVAPRADAASGRPRLPSRLLLELAGRAAGRPVGLDEYLSGAPLRSVWRRAAGMPGPPPEAAAVWLDGRERDTAVLLALGEARDADAATAYLAEVLGERSAAERRLGTWQAARSPVPGVWDGLLGDAARGVLAARRPFDDVMHPTRLERYLSCPFDFYLRDVLLLDVPEEPDEELEMTALEFGTLAHAILQATYQRLIPLWEENATGPDISSGPDTATALTALEEAFAEQCTAAERRGVTGAPLAWDVRRQMLLEDLRQAVCRDPVFGVAGGRPQAVEWRFGEAVDRPVELSLTDGRRIRFAGRIDRIDHTACGTRVIDYKTGRGETEGERLKKGLSVQLPVYRLAVRQSGEASEGPVSCLYRLVTRRGGLRDIPLPDDESTSETRLIRLVEAAVKLVDAGLFPRSREGRCDYCDLRYACGVSAWTRTRKREHEALRDVVRLQHSGPGDEGGDDV